MKVPQLSRWTSANYLLRFDDICPTMDWAVWDRIEAMLIENLVSPILAVVPDNRDPKLAVDAARLDFWERVRGWQARGWAIGLHGFQHHYVNREGGLLGLNRQSEFAGLPEAEQMAKLRQGLAIFREQGVRADCWVAPAHSFDWATVRALSGLELRVISDGFALAPYRDRHETIWIPQQFATMHAMPAGVWTFCYHHNRMAESALHRFERDLRRLAPAMIALRDAVALAKAPRTSADAAVGIVRHMVSGMRRLAGYGRHGAMA